MTSENNKFYFKKTITDADGFFQIIIPPGAYEIEALDKDLKRIIIDEEQYKEATYLFKIKPNCPTLG